MRSVVRRSAVVVLSVVLAAGAFAAPRSGSGATRAVKKFIRVLGDLLTVPTPAPAPPPKQP